jgi:hypothetical protein
METPIEQAKKSMLNEPKTRHDLLEDMVSNIRMLILAEFQNLWEKEKIRGAVLIDPDFVIQFVPNDYTAAGVARDNVTGNFIVSLVNNETGETMEESLFTLNTDDMLALLYWTNDIFNPQK